MGLGTPLGDAINYVDVFHFRFATDSSDIVPAAKGPIDPEAYLWQARPHGGSLLNRTKFTVECSKTHWSSESSTGCEENHIVIDLHSVRNVNDLSMRPLLHKDDRGQIAKHEVLVSVEGRSWKKVAYGTWGWNKSIKLSIFESQPAQYVKLVAKTEAPPSRASGAKYPNTVIKIVDINVYASLSTIPDDPSEGAWGGHLSVRSDIPVCHYYF
ncbi:discoidin domain-containing protein [Aspergillus ruber CBS 135680]|uniref:F5/8 type C domain-containing protein n=1 Tax=Aspergillus ruber (strain CBS 135680) TaxID=1388766 RepID=A0A017S670_ASPRC|nr:uncharacterized protein EURHEDRAFT_380253 [Aspergillus ruber CBS 135680]EYE92457.1 hypothetical protein EURHEDRAFT_380253 [Aspergillus ruber CBS 135680]